MLFEPRERGQGLVEYGLVIMLVALIIIIILAVLGTRLSIMFSQIASAL